MPRNASRRLLLATLFLLIAAPPTFAQAPTVDGQPRRYGDPFTAVKRDSVKRSLGGPWQLWSHAGFGWLSSPGEVRERYGAGLDVGLSGDRRFADRVALRARIDFDDLPSTKPDAVIVDGLVYATNIDYGHGWQIAATGGGAMRLWNHFWVDGGAGIAYFTSGFGDADSYVDIATGQLVQLNGRSGWGPLWSAGARYEFQPSSRNRLLAEFRYASLDRDGTQLEFFSVRAGFRLF